MLAVCSRILRKFCDGLQRCVKAARTAFQRPFVTGGDATMNCYERMGDIYAVAASNGMMQPHNYFWDHVVRHVEILDAHKTLDALIDDCKASDYIAYEHAVDMATRIFSHVDNRDIAISILDNLALVFFGSNQMEVAA